MDFIEIVDKVRERFADADVSQYDDTVAFEFNIKGEGEGAFYVEVKDGKIAIEPYEYYDHDVRITMTANDLFKLINGKLDPIIGFTLGKIKVDGDLGKALELKKFI